MIIQDKNYFQIKNLELILNPWVKFFLFLLMFFVGGVFFCAQAQPALAIDIPITVREALPDNITTGWARTAEPVKLGVPILDEEGISSINQLAIRGLSDYQFRVLDTYPSGNIRWVLVDFPSSVGAANSTVYHLVDGTGQSSGTLAVDNGTAITVNTGTMTAIINKQGGNIIDSLSVGGVSYISSGNNGGLVLTDNTNALWTSYNKAGSVSAVIEENGPFRTSIKIEGSLYNAAGTNVKMRFGLRLHFYKNKNYIKASLTLKNDLAANVTTAFLLNGFKWQLSTTMSASPSYLVSGNDGDLSGTLSQTVHVLQGQSTFRAGQHADVDDRWIASRGYEIAAGSTVRHAFSTNTKYANGRAEVTDGSKKISLSFFQLSGNYGSGFTLGSTGALSFDVLSTFKGGTYNYSFFAYETREFMIGFGTSENAANLETMLNYPLTGLADFDRYRATGAFWGETRLANYQETVNFFHGVGGVPDFSIPNPSEAEPVDGLYSTFSQIGPHVLATTAVGGPGGNLVHSYIYLLRYLQTGLGGYYLLTKNYLEGMIDEDFAHAKDFDMSSLGNCNAMENYSGDAWNTMNGVGIGYKTYVESEHPHWLAIVPWYYITGDERIKENFQDIVNYRKWSRWGVNDWPTISPDSERWYIYDIRDVVTENYLFPGTDNNYQQLVESAINSETSDSNHSLPGWDTKRGFWMGRSDFVNRVMHSFFVTEKHAENMGLVYRILSSTQLSDKERLVRKLRDRLVGLGHFNHVEMYADARAGLGRDPNDKYWVWYDYGLDSVADDSNEDMDYRNDSTFIQAFAFERTGDQSFIDFATHLPVGWMDTCQTAETLGTPSILRMIYDYYRKDTVAVGYPALNVVSQGNGSYSISWTPPAGVVLSDYVLKYSSKNIVVRNDYNRRQNIYQYNTATNVPFWSADEYLISGSAPIPISASSINATGLTNGLNFMLQYVGVYGVYTPDTSAPATPTNLSPTPISSSQINLSWTASTDNVAVSGYRVYRNGTQIATTTTNSYNNTGLAASTTYTYRVSAYDAARNFSAQCSAISVSTLSSDTTPPQGSVSINSGAPYTKSTSTILSLAATDLSTVTQMKLSDISTNFASLTALPFTSTYAWTLLGIDGVKTVYAWFKDGLNNWNTTPYSDTIILDLTSPSISNIAVGSITSNSAIITYTTSEQTVGYLNYGLSSIYTASTTEETTYSTAHTINLTNLSASSTYNYQVVVFDHANNQVAAVNHVFTTLSNITPDTIAPAIIVNLSASTISETSANLSWSAPGNNNNTGFASAYELKYSTTAISASSSLGQRNSWWTNATSISGEPTPRISGTSETFIIAGLTASTQYYFAIKSVDEAGNISSTSNIISFTTLAAAVTPPSGGGGGGSSGGGSSGGSGSSGGGGGAVSTPTPTTTIIPQTFTAIGAKNQIFLNWQNPTTQDFVKVKIFRKLNSSPSSPTDTNAQLVYEGSAQQFSDINLQNDTTYYYALYAYDRNLNVSTPKLAQAKTDVTKETVTVPKVETPTTTQTSEQENTAAQTSSGRRSLIGVKSAEVETITKEEAKTMIEKNQTIQLNETTKKIYDKIMALATKQQTQNNKYAIADFIHNGTPTTIIIGAGERGGSIASFRNAFGKLPETETDWQDVIKIANGRWPTQRNITAEQKSETDIFAKIYGRTANLKNQNDNAAVTVITYGLRPAQRNTNSEKNGIIAFKYYYKRAPTSAADWDIVRSIAYSGAKR